MIRMAALITVLASTALAGCAAPDKKAEEDQYLTGSRIATKTPSPTDMVKTIGSRQTIEDSMRNNSLYFLSKPQRIVAP